MDNGISRKNGKQFQIMLFMYKNLRKLEENNKTELKL